MNIPLIAIKNSGIRLNTDVWVIYNVIKSAIDSKWAHKDTFDGIEYTWVSSRHIKSQLDCLPDIAGISDNALYRKIKQLEECGLIARMAKNQEVGKCFLTSGPAVDMLSYSQPIAKTQGGVLQDCNGGIAKTQTDKSIKNNTITDNPIPPTPLVGSTSEPTDLPIIDKKAPRVKKRITFIEASKFYEEQIRSFGLEDPSPLPQEVAARREQLRNGYKGMYKWMVEGDAGMPDGCKGNVMTMAKQLSFEQVRLLIDVKPKLTWYQIKQYLIRLETFTENKNSHIYQVILKWYEGDLERGKVPPRSDPKNTTTPQKIVATAPKPTNREYTA